VDHVLESKTWYETCKKKLKGKRVFWVDVRCSLDILKKREKKRGDRLLGFAEKQLKMLYDDYEYKPNVVINTSNRTSKECASEIKTYFDTFTQSLHNTQLGSELTTHQSS
jgi:chloramphenicol 3-O-phosphotransferase